MQVKVIFFGPLTDIPGSRELLVTDVESTDALLQRLHTLYPALAAAKYRVAVEKEIISGNTMLKAGDTVALLPPYAGG